MRSHPTFRVNATRFGLYTLGAFVLTALACQLASTASPATPIAPLPAIVPTPLPTSTPIPFSTPISPITPLPAQIPTPVYLKGLRTVTPDTWGLYVTDASVSHAVAIRGVPGEIFLINISSGEARQLTQDGNRKREAVISDNYVAWIASISDTSAQNTEPSESTHIFLLERESGEAIRITDTPGRRRHLRMDERRLVWQDRRNEFNEDSNFYDVYAYDAHTKQEFPIAVARQSADTPNCARRPGSVAGQQG